MQENVKLIFLLISHPFHWIIYIHGPIKACILPLFSLPLQRNNLNNHEAINPTVENKTESEEGREVADAEEEINLKKMNKIELIEYAASLNLGLKIHDSLSKKQIIKIIKEVNN